MSTHTKGPWGIGVETDTESAQIISADGGHLARVEQYPIIENAQLIASAPDMLEVLEAVLAMINNGAAQNISGDSIARVIRKARGNS